MQVPIPDALLTPHKLNRLVLTPSFRKGDFDSHLCDCPFPFRHEGRYWLFYNAKDRSRWPWREQIGSAWSDDLERWHRCPENPLVRNAPAGAYDELFASDPVVLRLGNRWILFYYGLAADGHARDGAAFSDDLIHWTKPEGGKVLVDVGPVGAVDSQYAHKPGIITRDGVLYHFYCAVRAASPGETGEIDTRELRGIAVATSRPVGS